MTVLDMFASIVIQENNGNISVIYRALYVPGTIIVL